MTVMIQSMNLNLKAKAENQGRRPGRATPNRGHDHVLDISSTKVNGRLAQGVGNWMSSTNATLVHRRGLGSHVPRQSPVDVRRKRKRKPIFPHRRRRYLLQLPLDDRRDGVVPGNEIAFPARSTVQLQKNDSDPAPLLESVGNRVSRRRQLLQPVMA